MGREAPAQVNGSELDDSLSHLFRPAHTEPPSGSVAKCRGETNEGKKKCVLLSLGIAVVLSSQKGLPQTSPMISLRQS